MNGSARVSGNLYASGLPTASGFAPLLSLVGGQLTKSYTTTIYCAISEVNVSYSPQGVAPSFYAKSKAPVFIQLSITLKELNIRLGDKYGGTNIGAGAYDNLKGQVKDAINGLESLKAQ